MRDTAEQRVALGWGRAHSIGGPLLMIPIDTRTVDPASRREAVRRDIRFLLPESLDVVADLTPVERHSGIYRVNGYTASLAMTARFRGESLQDAISAATDSSVAWPEVRLLLPPTDLRGARPQSLDRRRVQRHCRAGRTARRHRRRHDFLPASYQLSEKGFNAEWQILEVNREFPQRWDNGAVSPERVAESAFGVSLYAPVDIYQRNYRAIHYAILFISITFLSLFLWEQIAKRKLHTMQYLLIGLALATFYLLLIALSEHMSFALAYALAAAGQVTVLGSYLVGAMRARLAGSVAAAGIAAVYGALYLLVLSEQYALLLGALLLFVILAAVLWVTRRVDWHQLASEMRSGSTSA